MIDAEPEGVCNAATANSLSVVRADGLDWVRVVGRVRPWYNGPAPVWSRRALRDLRDERGVKAKDLWREIDVLPSQAARSGGLAWVGVKPSPLDAFVFALLPGNHSSMCGIFASVDSGL